MVTQHQVKTEDITKEVTLYHVERCNLAMAPLKQLEVRRLANLLAPKCIQQSEIKKAKNKGKRNLQCDYIGKLLKN